MAADCEAATTYLVTVVAAVAGFTYILWDDFTYVLDTHQSSTPMPRAVGSIALLSAVYAPLLIAPLIRTAPVPTDGSVPAAPIDVARAEG